MIRENRDKDNDELKKLIKQLRFEEYESEAPVIPITISKYVIGLKETASVKEILTNLESTIKMNSSDVEGFTNPTWIEDGCTLRTTYFKKSPIKIEVPEDGFLIPYKIWPVVSRNKADIIIRGIEETIENNGIEKLKKYLEIYLVGGDENFTRSVWKKLFKIIKDTSGTQWISGNQHKFTYTRMRQMLEKLEGTKYIKLDPRQNKKFAKILQDVGDGKKKSIEYLVEEIDIKGYKVVNSPGILPILEEKNIRIMEILGKTEYSGDYLITVWIRKDGKVTVYIPVSLLENADENEEIKRIEAIEKAIEIYKNLITPVGNNVPNGKIEKQVTLFKFQK